METSEIKQTILDCVTEARKRGIKIIRKQFGHGEKCCPLMAVEIIKFGSNGSGYVDETNKYFSWRIGDQWAFTDGIDGNEETDLDNEKFRTREMYKLGAEIRKIVFGS